MQVYPLVPTVLHFALVIHVTWPVRFSYYVVLLLPGEQSTIASTNSTHISGMHFAAMYFYLSHCYSIVWDRL